MAYFNGNEQAGLPANITSEGSETAGADGLSIWACNSLNGGSTIFSKTLLYGVEDRELQIGDLVLFKDGMVGKVIQLTTSSFVVENTSLVLKGADGRGIVSIELTETGEGDGVRTEYIYTVTYTDGTTDTIVIEGGLDGAAGENGISPTVEVVERSDGHVVTISDYRGSKSFVVLNGEKGEKGEEGEKGADGFSPLVTINKSGKTTTISITDKSGTKTATINDGEDGKDGSGDVVPDGWKNAVDEVVNKIRNLHNNGASIHDCITFAFFTDTHNRLGHQGVLIKEVLRRIGSGYCFFGGDAVDNGSLETEADMIANIDEFDEMMKVLPIEYDFRTVGNHDGMWKTSAGVKNNQPWNKVYNEFFRRQTIPRNRHFGGSDFTYFYVDDENSKVRFVFLNSMWFDGVSSKTTNGFGKEQINWLINEALVFDTEGWEIVFISHAPLTNYQHSYLRDVKVMQGILTAYANKTTYTGAYTDSNTAHAVPTVSVDYSTGITAKIIGWFSGHIHRDMESTVDATTDSSNPVELPFWVITTTSDLGYDYDVEGNITGSVDSDTGHVIDFVTINKSTKTVNITRLGASARNVKDREYSYDVAATFSVINNLTNATNSNTATKVVEGGSYSATISAKSGYVLSSVSVTMGGVEQNVTNGVINISEVKGDIVITATATEVPAYTNLFNYQEASLDSRLSSSGGVSGEAPGYFVTGLMELPDSWKGDGTDRIYIYNPNNSSYASTLNNQKVGYYQGATWKVSAILVAGSDANNCVRVTVNNGVASFVGAKKSGSIDANAAASTHFRLCLSYNGTATAIPSQDALNGVIVAVNEEITL